MNRLLERPHLLTALLTLGPALVVTVLLLLLERERVVELPVVAADYQRCVTVRTAPLLERPTHNYDYRMGQRPFGGDA